jgi:hypothetical protein
MIEQIIFLYETNYISSTTATLKDIDEYIEYFDYQLKLRKRDLTD